MLYRSALILLLVIFVVPALGQLSEGGKPIAIQQLKSARADAFIALQIPPQELDAAKQQPQGKLKAFRFAYTIPVDYNLTNAGQWYDAGNYRVWQLKLQSPGALSLNVIFDRYRLPEGARLFLFSEGQEDLIGAFTAANNKADGMLATLPVAGDKLIIQYEVPANAPFQGELALQSVNHDFVGLKVYNGDRRPLGESGSCNVNVNCDYLQDYRLAADAVCRVLIKGNELCTGTLLNNTGRDGTPYLLTANHCIGTASEASTAVFVFNYESPYCKSIDGDVLNSVSGSVLKATATDLDFALVELSVKPPKSFQPYYLGWNRQATAPSSSVCVHHPLGDIKKVAVDNDAASAASFTRDYVAGAFWNIGDWDEGTTEIGSSGAALVDGQLHVRGSLVGGDATCGESVNDYFVRFDYDWDHYAAADKQLKAWLDPENTGATTLGGFNPYGDQCSVLTNLKDGDQHSSGQIDPADQTNGYYGGTNAYGFTEFAEAFQFQVPCKLQGFSMGVARKSVSASSVLTVSVYEGGAEPGALLYTQDFSLSGVDVGVMNDFAFNTQVETDGSFYVAWSVDGLQANDVFAAFLTNRTADTDNSFLIRDGGDWYTYPQKSGSANGAAAVVVPLICHEQLFPSDGPFPDDKADLVVYPNPVATGQELSIRFREELFPTNPQVFDLLGNSYAVNVVATEPDQLRLSFNGLNPGIYFVRLTSQATGKVYSSKVMVVR